MIKGGRDFGLRPYCQLGNEILMLNISKLHSNATQNALNIETISSLGLSSRYSLWATRKNWSVFTQITLSHSAKIRDLSISKTLMAGCQSRYHCMQQNIIIAFFFKQFFPFCSSFLNSVKDFSIPADAVPVHGKRAWRWRLLRWRDCADFHWGGVWWQEQSRHRRLRQ